MAILGGFVLTGCHTSTHRRSTSTHQYSRDFGGCVFFGLTCDLHRSSWTPLQQSVPPGTVVVCELHSPRCKPPYPVPERFGRVSQMELEFELQTTRKKPPVGNGSILTIASMGMSVERHFDDISSEKGTLAVARMQTCSDSLRYSCCVHRCSRGEYAEAESSRRLTTPYLGKPNPPNLMHPHGRPHTPARSYRPAFRSPMTQPPVSRRTITDQVAHTCVAEGQTS